MPGIDFREARARLRLAAVLDLLGFQPRARHGEQLRGPCPVHRSRSAASRSFAAHLGKGLWHCFACGAGGNTLDLWAAVTHQDLHAAVLDLCRRLGSEVPWLRAAEPCSRRRAARGDRTVRPETTMHDP
jgi:DNA primase